MSTHQVIGDLLFGALCRKPLQACAGCAYRSGCELRCAAAGLREDLCRRFLRVSMGNYVFAEDNSTKHVRRTAASRCLATHQGLRDAVGWQCDELAPVSPKLIATWETHGQDVADPIQERPFHVQRVSAANVCHTRMRVRKGRSLWSRHGLLYARRFMEPQVRRLVF